MFLTASCCCPPCLPCVNNAYARCRSWDSIHNIHNIHNSNASSNDTSTNHATQKLVPRHACLIADCLTTEKPWQTPRCCHLQDATVDECGVCGGLSDSCAILVQAQLQLTLAALQVCCPVPASLHLILPRQSLPAKQPGLGCCTHAHAKLPQR